jgi:hypothetical protein
VYLHLGRQCIATFLYVYMVGRAMVTIISGAATLASVDYDMVDLIIRFVGCEWNRKFNDIA